MNNVLIVEDDPKLRGALCDTLELAGYEVTGVECGESAVAHCAENKPGIVVSDINMDGMGGHELLRVLRKQYCDLPVLLMTAYGNIEDAVHAMQDGAVDYLAKPFEPNVLLKRIQAFLYPTAESNDDPVVVDPSSAAVFSLAKRVAVSDVTVMVLGESGTGKEVISRYIHQHSKRVNAPFVAINCAAIPENMLEATLFGYEKGAFTGAYQACPGKFERAQGGTILLDEISEMELGLQAKLLRVLQERELERLGGRKTIKLDVRVIATSNRNLLDEVVAKRFREDLYYRLNVFPLTLKPLRDRAEDIVPIAEHLLQLRASESGRKSPEFSHESKQKLIQYQWPGNVRELDNVVQRALVLQHEDVINKDDLQLILAELNRASVTPHTEVADDAATLNKDLKNCEYDIILKAIAEKGATRKAIAEKLGISPRTLRYKLAKMRDLGLLDSVDV